MEQTKRNMSKLIMCKGLPGSGKSTWAKEIVKNDGYKRVSKDDLRAMIDDSKWSTVNEKQILDCQLNIVYQYMQGGYNIVVDDTNFAYEDKWRKYAEAHNYEFEAKFFDTPVKECIDRDAKRGEKSVGKKVIWGMYNNYLKPKPIPYNKELPDAWLFDIDGTLANMCKRSPYDWYKVGDDTLNESVANVLDGLKAKGDKIIIMSGRDSVCKDITEKWLQENNVSYDAIFMRGIGDSRKDSVIKLELYNQNIKDKYNVLGVFDDRDQVVDMWRSMGLNVYQVNYGDF